MSTSLNSTWLTLLSSNPYICNTNKLHTTHIFELTHGNRRIRSHIKRRVMRLVCVHIIVFYINSEYTNLSTPIWYHRLFETLWALRSDIKQDLTKYFNMLMRTNPSGAMTIFRPISLFLNGGHLHICDDNWNECDTDLRLELYSPLSSTPPIIVFNNQHRHSPFFLKSSAYNPGMTVPWLVCILLIRKIT